jgi:hypothetical protein
MNASIQLVTRQPRALTATVDTAAEVRQQFYRTLGWEGGRVEVVAGTNKADNTEQIDLVIWNKETYGTDAPHTRKWFAPGDLTGIDRHVRALAARWGNVYISVGSYDPVPNRWKPGKLRYCRDAPRPRRCIVLDDVLNLSTLRLPPTWATETSPGNYQVGYICTDLLTPAQAQLLGGGAAMLAGLDNSAADPEQIIRIPTTLNTKLKCAGRPGTADRAPEGWEVRAAILDGPRYTRAELAHAFLPGGLAELGRSQPAKHNQKAPGSAPECLGGLLDGEQDPAWMEAVQGAADWRGHVC